MLGLDNLIAGLGGGSLVLAFAVALLLGLRHATDPDHLTAVAALIAGDPHAGTRRARRLGLAWGLGHATTLFAFGVPVVVAGNALPDGVTAGAELLIGLLIAGLAVRLLWRWKHGVYHLHAHTHHGVRHAHPHVHEDERGHGPEHAHAHPEALGRTPLAAYGIGLVHGIGGSGAAGVLLVGAISGGGAGVAALGVFAAATALSMALVSTGFGHALARGTLARHLEDIIPAMGCASLLFGAWYALAALAAVPYPF
jgi:ABC-type nickel/cobalt efflux system permease component RcnA